jgi:hypothetical protein
LAGLRQRSGRLKAGLAQSTTLLNVETGESDIIRTCSASNADRSRTSHFQARKVYGDGQPVVHPVDFSIVDAAQPVDTGVLHHVAFVYRLPEWRE